MRGLHTDLRTRLQGAGLLLVCAFALHALYGLRQLGGWHEPEGREMLLSLVVVVTGVIGAMLVGIGHALFEPYEWPPKH